MIRSGYFCAAAGGAIVNTSPTIAAAGIIPDITKALPFPNVQPKQIMYASAQLP